MRACCRPSASSPSAARSLDPIFPAPVAARTHTCQRIIDMVKGALAPALPHAADAASNGANTTAFISGDRSAIWTPRIPLFRDVWRRLRRPLLQRRQGRRTDAHPQHVEHAGRSDGNGVSRCSSRNTLSRAIPAAPACTAAGWGSGGRSVRWIIPVCSQAPGSASWRPLGASSAASRARSAGICC